MSTGGSPIMSYGGDNNYEKDGIMSASNCDLLIVISIVLLFLYTQGFFTQKKERVKFTPIDGFGKSSGSVYDQNYIGAYKVGEQTAYDGSSGYGANY